ncbi:MAG: hypothetical protein KDD56_00735, partial [Bdellovibrionales bacterium]|nr:hypothetical protein [Bdellovibrionales bacterium]
MQKVLLIEKDEKIASDIRCALDLIGVQLASTPDIISSKQLAKEAMPSLILARVGKNQDDSQALFLNVGTNASLFGIPVVFLGTEQELTRAKNAGVKAFADLNLPVEFPQFTYEVQRVLADALNWEADNLPDDEIKLPEPTTTVKNSTELDDKYALLFQLQSKIMISLAETG